MYRLFLININNNNKQLIATSDKHKDIVNAIDKWFDHNQIPKTYTRWWHNVKGDLIIDYGSHRRFLSVTRDFDIKDYIILLVGKSGSGKTTIAQGLECEYGWKQIESYTTRPQRYPNEKGHIFINDEQFDKLTDLVAYTDYNSYRYCATTQQVEDCQIYVIDVDGVKYFKEHYKGSKKPIVIELKTDESTLRTRMKERGDTTEAIEQRISNDITAFQDVDKIKDYTVDTTGNIRDIIINISDILEVVSCQDI